MLVVHGGLAQGQSFARFSHTLGAHPHADYRLLDAVQPVATGKHSLNRAGYIQRRCHIAPRSTVGNRQSHRLLYHRFHTHARHGSLKEQTAMEALVRSMVKFLILALVNMDRPTKGASHDLVHQLLLGTATSLKGTTASFSLHTTLRKTHV